MKRLADQKLKEEKKKAAQSKQAINNVPVSNTSPPISLSNNGLIANNGQLPHKVPSPLMFTPQNPSSFIQQPTLPPSYPTVNREYDNTFPPLGAHPILERHSNVTTPPLQQNTAITQQDIPHIGLWNKKSSTGLTNPPSPPSTTPPPNTFQQQQPLQQQIQQSQIQQQQQANKYMLPFQGISAFSSTPFIAGGNNPIPNNNNSNPVITANNNEIYSRQQTQGMYDYTNVLSNLWMNNQNSPFYQSYNPHSVTNSVNVSNNVNNTSNNNINSNIPPNSNEDYAPDWSSIFRPPSNMSISQTMLYDQYQPTSTLFGNTSVSPFFQNFQQPSSLHNSGNVPLTNNQVTPPNTYPVSSLDGSLMDQLERDRVKAREAVLEKYQNILPPQRPCCYCGEESSLECNVCAKTGYATFFCSPEHQSLMWKEHMRVHQAYLASLQQKKQKNQKNNC
eukprot:TRINITY_DN11894_c0_g1_i1.p1 TRINITY_DN11894_c0_g1~~TRINITY_DN11894_c0_g1_i1.p1  ORF type:complete len:472 (+),score=115.28 TRINITY_DN11894_c0_g1_i1:77-1417(+)